MNIDPFQSSSDRLAALVASRLPQTGSFTERLAVSPSSGPYVGSVSDRDIYKIAQDAIKGWYDFLVSSHRWPNIGSAEQPQTGLWTELPVEHRNTLAENKLRAQWGKEVSTLAAEGRTEDAEALLSHLNKIVAPRVVRVLKRGLDIFTIEHKIPEPAHIAFQRDKLALLVPHDISQRTLGLYEQAFSRDNSQVAKTFRMGLRQAALTVPQDVQAASRQ